MWEISLVSDKNLADLLGLLHVAEGINDVSGVELMVGQRMEVARLEHIHHLVKESTGNRRSFLEKLISIDAKVGDIISERPETQVGIFIIVTLAKFQEAAEGTKHLDTPSHRLARQGIKNHVYTNPTGLLQDFLGKGQGA